jgi:nucleoside 2-deoxyribosyltransferase
VSKVYLSYSMTHDDDGSAKVAAEKVATMLRAEGYEVFVPHEEFPTTSDFDPAQIVATETAAVKDADIMITLLAPTGSCGCGAEYQIAADNGIPIVAYPLTRAAISRFVLGLIEKSGGTLIESTGVIMRDQLLTIVEQVLELASPKKAIEAEQDWLEALGNSDRPAPVPPQYKTQASAGGCQKEGAGKLMVELVHPIVIRGITYVLQDSFEKGKYDKWNWLKGGSWSQFYGAALRHLYDWYEFADEDGDSGYSPLAHVLCDVMFLYVWEQLRLGTDDRLKTIQPKEDA